MSRLLSRTSCEQCLLLREQFKKKTAVVRRLFSSKYLLVTNTAITLSLSTAGDILCQYYQQRSLMPQFLQDFKKKESLHYDWNQTIKVVIAGSPYGPLSHYWYIWLDKTFVGTGLKTITKKIIADQLLFSPLYIVGFLCVLAALEHKQTSKTLSEQMKTDIKKHAPDLYTAECLVWPPAQLVNFCFVPLKYRVLFDNVISIVVDAYYSYVRFPKDIYHLPQEVDDNTNSEHHIYGLRHMTPPNILAAHTCSGKYINC